MAPANISKAAACRQIGSRRRTEAPLPMPHQKKMKPLSEVMARARYVVVEGADYSQTSCVQCGSGDQDHEMLLCDKCDKAFHMKCLRPIVVRVPIGSWLCPKCSGQRRVRSFSQKKIIDFFGIKKSTNEKKECASLQDARKRRRRCGSLVLQKKRRRLLPFIPSEDPDRRLKQMGTLASALTALQMEFSDELTYMPDLAARSANQAMLEDGGMQVLSKEDTETLEHCRAMCRRGECPPLIVVFDSCEGFTVEADSQIKDLTLIAEYTGDVDYLKNRENDDCDSMMTLLLVTEPSKSLVICPDKRGNIARFINGINNHTPDGKKKQNCKCVRYSVNGECRVFLVATRDIAKGERLYYDYNGYEHEYPTHHFL
ncbi:probable Histone-lysine N-methyltransferase ATXR5 isoform X2 [Tripterygium wilfordii]|uniref:probable Histone-lysine N-methyltransferase ATXR5 isoform X2 n=1 Tax=Tripterygium wilfordii TaxID=458696 RepID=UPI0018F841AB|nr:probable Histone-lysine N-methyltransferase ATXR5 isoform X2 [Tripterygium wilfordii]